MHGAITREFLETQIRPLAERYSFARALFIETSGLTVSSNLNQTFVEPLSAQRGIVVSVLHNGLMYEGSSVVHSGRDVLRTIRKLENTLRNSNQSGSLKTVSYTHLSMYRAEINKYINSENGFKNFEKIGAFVLLKKPFEQGDELNNTLKVRRHIVSDKYTKLIDEMYAATK